MSMQNITIEVTSRTPGKHHSRSLRQNALVPAVVYGPKTKPMNFNLKEQDATRYSQRAFENAIFTLQSADKDLHGLKVLRKDISIHPVNRRPIHMDFFALDMTKSVRVHVELRFVGKSLGVSEGGVFSAARRNVEIECLPTEIPESFDVDITALGLNQSLHVSDIAFPEGVKLITSPQETVATCAIVEEVVAAAPAADATTAAAATPGGAAPGSSSAGGATTAAAPAASDAKKSDKK